MYLNLTLGCGTPTSKLQPIQDHLQQYSWKGRRFWGTQGRTNDGTSKMDGLTSKVEGFTNTMDAFTPNNLEFSPQKPGF